MSGVPPTRKNGTTPGGLTYKMGARSAPEGVMVGVISHELSRFSTFTMSLLQVMGNAGPRPGICWAKSVDICGNMNTICRAAVERNHAHLWVMGDDHTFEPGIIMRLLAHDVDVVVPQCLKRYPPWMSLVFSHQNEDGHYVTAALPETGLTQIHAAGSAGMLISRRVLDAVGDPWFTPSPDAEGLNEDLNFCRKVREAGFKLYCDPTIALGHITLATVSPTWHDGQWHPEMDHDGIVQVRYDRPNLPSVEREPVAV